MLTAQQRGSGRLDWRERLPDSLDLILKDDAALTALNVLRTAGTVDRVTGLALLRGTPLDQLQTLAHGIKSARFDNEVFFNSNLHVNPTNICTLACRFCAFRRSVTADTAYALTVEEYLDRIRPHADLVDEVHSVGGLHPTWSIEHHVDLIRAVRQEYPHIQMKCLTAVEIRHLSELSDLTIEQILIRLRDAGLTSLPGGGAEILDDRVRDVICRGKESSDEYLMIHATAHRLDIPTNCTMLFGTVESAEERIVHLLRLTELQVETGGFQCFIPYPYLPDNSRLPEAQLATGAEILRMVAVSRIILDSIPHIKAYRMNIGDRMAQLALTSGADDIDGTVGHEEIMHEAGSETSVSDDLDAVARLIVGAGAVPVRRNTDYSEFKTHRTQRPFRGQDSHRLPVVESA